MGAIMEMHIRWHTLHLTRLISRENGLFCMKLEDMDLENLRMSMLLTAILNLIPDCGKILMTSIPWEYIGM